MFLKLLLALGTALALVALVISLQPATYNVSRSATIEAPPAVIYELVSDFHNWNAWSPWAKLDPNIKQTYEGAQAGTGAVYRWAGDQNAGEGLMRITEAVPGERVALDLEFLKPFPSSGKIRFRLHPQGSGTSVIWAMEGKTTFASKALNLFYGMEKLVAPDFEKGLAQLKKEAEARAKQKGNPVGSPS